MKYPILYSSNETDFFSLGLGPLKNTIKATVTEERNGAFYLEAEILTDEAIFPLVLNDCIIKADAGHLLKDQRFRIKRIVPKHNGRAEIYAEHVSYITSELTLAPEVTVNGTAIVALNQWLSNIVESNPLSVYSDIGTTGQTKWRVDNVENPRHALGGVEGSILDVWGGEYRFDNYHISLLNKRGNQANTVLAYGRNIIDFEQERNIADTYTSICPFAIYTNANEQEVVVTIDGQVVDSPYVGNYPNRRTKSIDFSSEFEHDEVPTKARLQTLAEQYIAANNIGVPKTSIKVSFLDLSKSADYDEYKHLEEVNLCDDVRVHYPKLGVNTTAKVVKTVWNVLTESYDEIEIGERRSSLATTIVEQGKAIDRVDKHVTVVQIAANGKNKIFRGLVEPTNGMGINDLWYKPVGDGETELYRFNGSVWSLERVSAGLLGGLLDATNGDVDLINVNVSTLVGNISDFIRSYWNAINSRASIDGNELRFSHNDGSYTSMRAGGLMRYVGSTGKQYHHLTHLAGYVLNSTTAVRWAQLPDDFKGKDFTVFIAFADSLQASYDAQALHRVVCTGHPNYSIDYVNARVPLIGYKLLTDGTTLSVGDVQGLLIAIA